jgi:ChrR Cupin-like domain
MSSKSDTHGRKHAERVAAYALQALPSSEVALVEAQISSCADCRTEFDALRQVVESFVAWPTDVLRPSTSLWKRLEQRISAETGVQIESKEPEWKDPDWEEVASRISCKLLATDGERNRVSMLVRLAPGAAYPSHSHSGVEELHLLDGELWIDERKLFPGDYYRAEPGTIDSRVWSETGCTCVLLTSTRDVLR